MVNKMKLGEIYDPEFLRQFGKHKEKFERLSLKDESPYIDLDEIANVMEINIEINPSLGDDKDGEYDHNSNKIILNSKRPKTRMRFTEAHEIGHAVLDHQGVSWREINNSNLPGVSKWKEIAANNFAAELLMPSKLLLRLVHQYTEAHSIDEGHLTVFHQIFIKQYLAQQLGVSEEAMGYRINNLDLFVAVNND